jgi:hypothetical protein
MALYFQPYSSKTYCMPNSANRSSNNKNAGQGQPEHRTSRSSQKDNTERSDLKHGDHSKDHKGDTSRSSNQGRKSASGGSADNE